MQPVPKKPISIKNLYYAMLESPVGLLGIAATDQGICNIRAAQNSERQFVRYLDEVYARPAGHNPKRLQPALDQLTAYFEGRLTEFDCRLDISSGTPFQQQVWQQLQTIPFGETRSYGWLAEQLSNPQAHRAVGNANGRNPVPIIIPCHRVIQANGNLGGYTGGLHIKEFLLDLEHARHAVV
ncbi:methylated-DNA--[protein]-cysteine S-methyltransferase [Nitrospina watsonii]|uniref:Methylated-DNA--protein-cysteine methyltransferase n=1 Tax=Nitrospina watsonii TaxID=1323948 RepID=A0ABM9HDP1_9BACT|nr:methylated-DNA--[protein]-cysteine S-methyltransferase [Nitrospina watsonii]CAI2718222.1 Methylated-DNA--protein-cysteine methyltransferase [Nitrospina watsonii]